MSDPIPHVDTDGPVGFDGLPLWTDNTGRVAGFRGNHIDVDLSDAVPNCIVITFHDEAEHPTFEISPAEARELIAALAGVL